MARLSTLQKRQATTDHPHSPSSSTPTEVRPGDPDALAATAQRVSNLLSLCVSHLALNPGVTATLRDPGRYATVVRALKWLVVCGVVKHVNRALNGLALNSYRLRAERARWTWEKEVAVVTGGCSGIGALVVQRLASRGLRVAVLDIQQLPASLQGYAHIKFYACDITDPAAVAAAAHSSRTDLGSPSILINNAGVLDAHTILATSHAYLRKLFDVNVLSNWTTVQAFLPAMIRANKGHVVTIASTASYVGVAGMADYTASKAAVLSFHEGLNQELALSYKAPGVLTTSVHPNWVRTPLIEPVADELAKRGAVMIEPEEVADAVVAQVLSCKGAQVFVPRSAGKISLLRALPNWVQEGVRKGVSKTITESVAVGGM
ncbi:NAD(P)-binding protein [Lizonia empirigonia]|nr:NAD(P)-binding protein [Lizonia empirigonia]